MLEPMFGGFDFVEYMGFFIAGAAAIMLAIVWAYYQSRGYRGWKSAEGRVVKTRNRGEPGTLTEGIHEGQRVVFVEYEVEGETLQTSFRHPFLREGKQVRMLYEPGSPNVGEVLDTLYGKYGAQIIVAIFGALPILVSLDASVYPF
jgi:hypothetical protein